MKLATVLLTGILSASCAVRSTPELTPDQLFIKKGLTDNEIALIPDKAIPAFTDLAKRVNSEELKQVASLPSILGSNFNPQHIDTYREVVKKDKDVVKKWLFERVGNTAKPEGNQITESHYNAFVRLLDMGVAFRYLASMQDEILQIARSFQYGRFPSKLLNTFHDNQIDHSMDVAEADSSFSMSVPWLKSYIKQKVDTKEHATRYGTEYFEHSDVLDDVENKHMLVLLKKYVDFFETEKAWEQVKELYNGSIHDDEKGGLIMPRGKGIELVGIRQYDTEEDRIKKQNKMMTSYAGIQILYVTSNLGDLHTHPQKISLENLRAHIPNPSTGPSGILTEDSGYISDLQSLRDQNMHNPFAINVLITPLPNGKYNVDTYFVDVVERNGRYSNKGKATVLDLGVYSPKN